MQLTETRFPDYAPYQLDWSSSNPDIVQVDDHGFIFGKALGKADITVVANGDAALTATCHVTVENMPIANSIAEYKAMQDGTAMTLMLNDALVVFAQGSQAYVRDATGALAFDNTGLSLSQGDVLNGNVYGRLTIKDNVPHLSAEGRLTHNKGYTVSSGHLVMPREVSVAEVTPDDYGDLITLKATRLFYEQKVAVWAIDGEKKIRLYNTFQLKNVSMSTDVEGKWYDVTGIFLTNRLKGSSELIDEIALTVKPKEVEAPPMPDSMGEVGADSDDKVSIYTTDGRFVAVTTTDHLSQLPLKPGIYVARTASRVWKVMKR